MFPEANNELEMKRKSQITTWLEEDQMRMQALRTAASLDLNDWCIAAGLAKLRVDNGDRSSAVEEHDLLSTL